MISIQAYVNGEWIAVTGRSNSECFDRATELGATKVKELGWLAVWFGGEWVYMGKVHA
jgi:hypothetical protein